MTFVYALIIVALSALLWRIRGGLWKEYIPMNKIWYSVFFAIYSLFYFVPDVTIFLIGFVDCYTSYQLYGWGSYIGGIISGTSFNREKDAECDLIDDLLYPCRITIKGNTYWLKDFGRLFGFCGTSLTGLIITFLWGIFLFDFVIMISGLGMGLCYLLGYYLNKLIPEQKAGWGYGEWIFGAYIGAILAWRLLC